MAIKSIRRSTKMVAKSKRRLTNRRLTKRGGSCSVLPVVTAQRKRRGGSCSVLPVVTAQRKRRGGSRRARKVVKSTRKRR
jgi:hypothetical protein